MNNYDILPLTPEEIVINRMHKAEALKEYPMLDGLQVPDLVSLMDGAIRTGDTKFAKAIGAILRETRRHLMTSSTTPNTCGLPGCKQCHIANGGSYATS